MQRRDDRELQRRGHDEQGHQSEAVAPRGGVDVLGVEDQRQDEGELRGEQREQADRELRAEAPVEQAEVVAVHSLVGLDRVDLVRVRARARARVAVRVRVRVGV